MGIREDIETKIADKTISQIHGRPSEVAVTTLTKELSKIAATVKKSWWRQAWSHWSSH